LDPNPSKLSGLCHRGCETHILPNKHSTDIGALSISLFFCHQHLPTITHPIIKSVFFNQANASADPYEAIKFVEKPRIH
jgi:hypothetical protein